MKKLLCLSIALTALVIVLAACTTEVVKEVPVERIVTQEVIKEVPVEKIVMQEVVKTVEVPKEIVVTKEVIREVPKEIVVTKEVIREVPKEIVVTKEVIREVPKEIVVTKEVIREVPKEIVVTKEVIREVPKEIVVTQEVIREVVITPTPLVTLPTPEPMSVSLPDPDAAPGTVKVAAQSLAPAVGINRHGASDLFNFMGVGESLFMPTETGVIQGPMLAKSFELSPDLSKVTVTIQDGVMFHQDFGEMTAEDVVWSLNDANAAITPQSIHGQAGDFRVLFKEATAIDASTFDLPFETFDPAWDGNRTNMFGFSFSVISKSAYEQNGEDWSRDNVIMTGPFELSSWATEDQAFLNAVPMHWRKTAEIDTLHLVAIPEGATRLAALLTGEIDVAKPEFKDLKRLVEAGFMTASAGGGRKAGIFWGGNYWETIDPRTMEPLPPIGLSYDPGVPWAVVVPAIDPMSVDARMEKARMVRWAMSLAIDRNLVNEALMDGLAWPEYMWSASVIQPEWQDRWLIPYDTARAEQILDEAGYPRGGDGIRFKADIFRADNNVDAISDAVAGFWDEVGIRTTVDKSAYSTVRPSLVARSFVKINIQAIGETATNRPFDWPKGGEMTSLGRGGFGPGVEVAEITQAILDAGNEPDRAKRVEINTALMDHMHYMMQGSAVVSLPDLLVFNSKSIASWPMRSAGSLDIIAYPEFIMPAR